ncbi:hypothetical protein N7505_007537 [Penicillium chrysogenum]|uniref:Uncharacterized protein n=1 Tax=Penicillium chrysogenum TaxID=5076 RepID=A0ABQ8WGM1_PENCH|nr:hypothetical protein N7505_007537 [Penicillium chrysogenum]
MRGLASLRLYTTAVKPRKNIKQSIDQLLREMTTLQKKILKFITTARLLFRTIKHPEFKELLPLRLARHLWQSLDTSSTGTRITMKFFLDLSISRDHILGLS